MSAVHQKRLILVITLVVGISIAAGLTLFALSKNINLFYTPTELLDSGSSDAKGGSKTIRLGGMVVEKSIVRTPDLGVEFVITDFKKQIKVKYNGILPDLFKEGKGVVAQGKLDSNGEFKAEQILAKHDENYMPPELTKGLKA